MSDTVHCVILWFYGTGTGAAVAYLVSNPSLTQRVSSSVSGLGSMLKCL